MIVFANAGFVDFRIPWRADVFSDAPQGGDAAEFGTLGINVGAVKATTQAQIEAALAALRCDPTT